MIQTLLARRFREALASFLPEVSDDLLDLIRPSTNPQFGDYQANMAMPLGKKLGKPPREVAAEILENIKLDDLCHPPEIAGPGFINLKIRDAWLTERLTQLVSDERVGVPSPEQPQTVIVDYSAPNVAKPMHVGHLRSTCIGDALCRTFRFLGHSVIGDNHIGDWGTQFGMIIYGYRNFLNSEAYATSAVDELARLYKLVRSLVSYHANKASLTAKETDIATRRERLVTAQEAADEKPDKKTKKNIRRLEAAVQEAEEALKSQLASIAAFEADAEKMSLAESHPQIGDTVLQETAKLHHGDAENRKLWEEVLPACEDEMNRIYARLGVTFDTAQGESFYQDRLAPLVEKLIDEKIATESDGAICVFLEGSDVPMLVRKKDGAFLYATTDLATIQYRVETYSPDTILYVVDHRQSLHFQHLFQLAPQLGYQDLTLEHVSFGTVMGKDGKPFKTREGEVVSLDFLLDEAVAKSLQVLQELKADVPADAMQRTAERIGIGAVKYADLSQNRTSDYVFDLEKMVALQGNTATYLQYAYARTQSIFRKGSVDASALRATPPALLLSEKAERDLALAIIQFPEALERVTTTYMPSHLTAYLYDLAGRFSAFFNECPVLREDNDAATRESRLLLCDLVARTLRQGLELLGIEVVERM